MADLAAKIARAREVLAKATPGEWKEGGPWPSISVIYQTAAGYYGPDGGQPPEYDMVCSIWQGVDHTGRMVPEHPERARHLSDAALIVLAVNALPALLDVAEAAAAYQEEMAALGNGVDPALSAALAKLALGPDGEGKEKGNG